MAPDMGFQRIRNEVNERRGEDGKEMTLSQQKKGSGRIRTSGYVTSRCSYQDGGVESHLVIDSCYGRISVCKHAPY